MYSLYFLCLDLQTLFGIINKRNESKKPAIALIVIIDDLDRCTSKKIIEMLEAIHLLLEQPRAPIAIFLAVDPYLILSAISQHIRGEDSPEIGLLEAKSFAYLDKIIHIPFCLPPIPKTDRLTYLESLLNDNSCKTMLKKLRRLKVLFVLVGK